MKDSYYVIFNRKGVDRFCKSDSFILKSGEYAVQMNLEVPDEVFAKPKIPTVKFTLDPEQIQRTIGLETEEPPHA